MLEREYNVPLRKEFLKAPKYKRANRAVRAVKDFVAKHMKSNDVSVGKFLNLEIWKNGMRNPPGKVSVKAVKDDSGKVTVELKELPKERTFVNKRLNRIARSEDKSSKPAQESKEEKPKEKAESKSDSEKTSSSKDVKKDDSSKSEAPSKKNTESKTKDSSADKAASAPKKSESESKKSDKKDSSTKAPSKE